MATQDNSFYLPESEYLTLVDSIGMVATIAMFELARSPLKSHQITRNFLGRAKGTLDAIKTLWQSQAYSDCWSLHRTLIDRLFHLHVLGRDQSFEAFDDWSFVQMYEARNAVRSDPDMKPKLVESFWRPQEEDKERYA